MKLKSVTIHKYKCVETDQSFSIEEDVTVFVGMNESGKTSLLEAIAKTNYFEEDDKFAFKATHDYPRREKKALDKTGDNPVAITCVYAISDAIQENLLEVFGQGVCNLSEISISTMYDNSNTWSVEGVDRGKFINNMLRAKKIHSKTLAEKLLPLRSTRALNELIEEYSDEDKVAGLKSLLPFYENKLNWGCPIQEYIVRNFLKPALPKFLYYDEYYALPSRISIEKLQSDRLEGESQKTAKALFELADINIEELLNADSFEDYVAELEATEATITDELFKYWTTNKNLDIAFKIDKRIETDRNGQRIAEHILDIRVKNNRARVSLPLENRSKGFNWFFSFLVWFMKVQEDKSSNYVLLLDEPGLNLHASAQADLLRFLNDLSERYQIIYTTHSPFMVQSEHLEKVRTVLETVTGTQISDCVHEKDPKTLFPLQAALGYNIAQNLFVSKNNLLVEGISDLVYLQVMSAVLEADGRENLAENITIVPTGGLEKVATFISLLRGNELNIVCLLDSFSDQKGKQKLDNMIEQKLIKEKQIHFAHDFVNGLDRADVEDFFAIGDYLKLFKGAFPEHCDLELPDVDGDSPRSIISRINSAIAKSRFNHYQPANWLAKQGIDSSFFDTATLNVFEKVLKTVNSLFEEQ